MATTQKLSTELILDAVVSSDFTDAFSTANKLMNDLSKHSNALEKELKELAKGADALDEVGKSSDALRRDMVRLDKQISEVNRSVDKFSDARQHFRNAKIGASALKNELGDLAAFAGKAALGIAGIGTAAAVALSPSQETLEFGDQIARLQIIPEMDDQKLSEIENQLLDLSTHHVNIELPDLTEQFNKLGRKFGIEEAQGLLPELANFQTITGKSITGDFQTDHDALIAALNITSAEQYKKLLEVLAKGVTHANLNLDNIDAGDLGTLVEVFGTDLNSTELQEALLIALKHKELDSEQFADKFREFLTRFDQATFIPEFDPNASEDELQKVLKQQEVAEKNIQVFAKYGLGEDSNLIDLVKTFVSLGEEQRKQLVHDLEPLLGGEVIDVLLSAPQGLETIVRDSALASKLDTNMQEDADKINNTWSAVWQKIGDEGSKATLILQKQFATVFGPELLAGVEKFSDFLSAHQDDIQKFFTGVHDTLSPIIKKVWSAVIAAWPDVKQFALDVWGELRGHWDAIAPVAQWLADKIWGIVKAVGGFLKDHPGLVATVIAGTVAFKAYKIASTAAQTGYDLLAGGVSMLQGHFHRLNAIAIGNQRELANTGNVALSTGRKFLEMGKNMLATKFPRFGTVISGLGKIGTSALGALPGIGAMGAGLWAAMAPILPEVLPIIAAIGAVAAGGYLVYKNWDGISDFFARHFETIRNVLMFVFPPLGLLIGLAGVIKQNWEPLKEFFSTLWETVKLTAIVVWEGIKFIVLGTLVRIKNIWSGITGFFSDLWGGVKGVFMDSPLAPLFSWMVDGIKKVFGPLLGFFTNFWDNVSNMAGRVIGWITDKFDKFNKILNRWFGWLSNKNKEMKEELGFKSEAKVDAKIVDERVGMDKVTDSPTVITPEAKTFIKETYDVNLDKLPVDFANELSGTLLQLETKERMVSTPEELEQVNVIKRDYLTDITRVKEITEVEEERNALEKVEMVLKKDLSVDTLPSDMDFEQPTEYVQQVIQGDSLLKPLSDIYAEQQKQTALLEVFKPKSPIVEMPAQASPVVNLPETAQPIINQPDIVSPDITIQEAIGKPVVNIPEGTQPVIDVAQPALEDLNIPSETEILTPDATVLNVEQITQEQPVFEQPETMPVMPVPASPASTPDAPQTTQIHNETANTDSGTVNITFHMNITQAPGEDGEAFAERVAALIRKELNSAADGFLTQ